jgi:hypothetical protein
MPMTRSAVVVMDFAGGARRKDLGLITKPEMLTASKSRPQFARLTPEQ